MSELLINQYHAEIAKYVQYGGDKKETSIRRAFANLLTSYCKPHDLLLVDELGYTTKLNTRVVPDGTIKDALALPMAIERPKTRAMILMLKLRKS